MNEQEIDPDLQGQRVRLKTDHGVSGITTGKSRKQGPFVLVQIEIGPNNKPFKRLNHLELVPEGPEPTDDLIRAGRFGGARDLRRVVAYHKIRGDLTDVLYSMESSLTDFYAHQFKPALKFIDSLAGRILIADEVGLGKTIEATYIWKEVQAREHGQRLLIICPSMLRQKWKSDLSRLFGIEADIFGAKETLERFVKAKSLPDRTPFVIISSYEGLRPRKDFDRAALDKLRPRDELARLISEATDGGEEPILDLVVFDEAHYVRNEETQAHLLARILVDGAKHAVFLSATPVQTSSSNLFSLLRLLDPDQFVNQFEFEEMLQSNAHLVKAQQALWSNPPDLAKVDECLQDALESPYFEDDPIIKNIKREAAGIGNASPSKRVDLGRRLEAHSLLGPYITRTRKREVEENRVERAVQVFNVNLSEIERETYRKVTAHLRERANGLSGFDLFPIISRQREMASSLPAALLGWRERDVMQEMRWEDLGRMDDSRQSDEVGDVDVDLKRVDVDTPLLERLEQLDSKYRAFRDEFLKVFLKDAPKEKVIVFAFFRGTLNYLARRLKSDGFDVAIIMGGSADDRDAVLESFGDPFGPQILLSSEVGSEGIDLQFCRVVVNYDLPWNPMKLEQRIGRIDRLGQKSERITIVNMAVQDTIEDKVLMRLYDRIEIFKESIGDLEDILGEVCEALQIEFFNPKLTDEERERLALMKELVIENNRKTQKEIADQAVNLVGFSNYLMEAVNETRDLGRWISAEELFSVVLDYFENHYPGTVIKLLTLDPLTAEIELSFEARLALDLFIQGNPSRRSQLAKARHPIKCVFDLRAAKQLGSRAEAIDPTHPLISWIQTEHTSSGTGLHKAIALEVEAKGLDVEPGDYAFAVEYWKLSGLRRECTLAYSGIRLSDFAVVERSKMEKLITTASRRGNTVPTQAISEAIRNTCADAFLKCQEILESEFGTRSELFYQENEARCDQQMVSVERLVNRKITEIQERIATYRSSGGERMLAAYEGQVRKQREILEERTVRVNEKRDPDVNIEDIAGGFIRVLPTAEVA